MGVGKHKDIVIIKGKSGVADGYGGFTEVYTSKWEGFADLLKSGGSREVGTALNLNSGFSIRFRKNPTLTIDKKDIVEYKGKVYGIVSIVDDEDRWIELKLEQTS
jgi:hypothetical protein